LDEADSLLIFLGHQDFKDRISYVRSLLYGIEKDVRGASKKQSNKGKGNG